MSTELQAQITITAHRTLPSACEQKATDSSSVDARRTARRHDPHTSFQIQGVRVVFGGISVPAHRPQWKRLTSRYEKDGSLRPVSAQPLRFAPRTPGERAWGAFKGARARRSS